MKKSDKLLLQELKSSIEYITKRRLTLSYLTGIWKNNAVKR